MSEDEEEGEEEKTRDWDGDNAEYLGDVLELIDTYVKLIAKQNEIIASLKEELAKYRRHAQRQRNTIVIYRPSQIMTSPPTPLRVDTCAEEIEEEIFL